MANRKSELYQALKELGATFGKPYVNYTEAEFEDMLTKLAQGEAPAAAEAVAPRLPQSEPNEPDPYLGLPPRAEAPERPTRVQPGIRREPQTIDEFMAGVVDLFEKRQLVEGRSLRFKGMEVPIKDTGAERAGLTYSHPDDIPIRVDLSARVWFMDEVAKPSIPKARMTRKTRGIDPGVKQVRTVDASGRLDEIYEVAGDEHRELITTVTLPSWQVGKYRDARFPFMIHTYNGLSGFDYMEVIRFFGGRDLVPGTIKRLYVGNQLCFHIPTTRDTIHDQFAKLKRG